LTFFGFVLYWGIMIDKHTEIIEILTIIRSKINSETDVSWTHFNTIEELTQMIDSSIDGLKRNENVVIEELAIHFAPTSTFQELSISNGWAEEYLMLADRFDDAVKKSWLRKLFSNR
jgi:hypothetical protein